jgi:hypothetical protein
MKYVVVQRTGFVPYVLSAWTNGTESWDCLRSRALAFDGPAARRIANQLNARRPGAPLSVVVEEFRR